jgi:hypothetical protein
MRYNIDGRSSPLAVQVETLTLLASCQLPTSNSQGEPFEQPGWKSSNQQDRCEFHSAASNGSAGELGSWELEVGSWKLDPDAAMTAFLLPLALFSACFSL